MILYQQKLFLNENFFFIFGGKPKLKMIQNKARHIQIRVAYVKLIKSGVTTQAYQ